MTRKIFFVLLMSLVVSVVAACGAVATPEWSAQAEETRVAQAATDAHLTEIAPTATPTDVPTATPTDTSEPTATPTDTLEPTATPTDTPEPTEAAEGEPAAMAGDPTNGELLFNTFYAEASFACVTCHYVDREDMLIGPGLLNVSVRAETRVDGQSAIEYLQNSILHPNDYIVEGYPEQLMPQVYADVFTDEEINDLVSYLFSLAG